MPDNDYDAIRATIPHLRYADNRTIDDDEKFDIACCGLSCLAVSLICIAGIAVILSLIYIF